MAKLRLGFLASHGGSNMQAIIDSCKSGKLEAIPGVVISNNSSSMALERAKKEGIPAFHLSTKLLGSESELDNAILKILDEYEIDIVVLAGYMKKIGKPVITKYKGRILNIHPALLPKYGGPGMYGKNVHESVIKAGEKVSGVTVHVVDEIYDNGRILAQVEVPVLAGDTPDSLAARVLSQEHIIYSETLQKIAKGEIVL